MKTTFDITHTSRNVLLRFLENHTLEALNKVPEGFSNNLIWNIGHIVVVQQMLVYKLAGLPMMVSDALVDKYKRGTRPEQDATADEVDQIKELLFATLVQTEKDYAAGLFKDYQEFTTMSGYTVQSSADAMIFNNYHEALHTGIMMQIRKFI